MDIQSGVVSSDAQSGSIEVTTCGNEKKGPPEVETLTFFVRDMLLL